jgi:hypothetical protein
MMRKASEHVVFKHDRFNATAREIALDLRDVCGPVASRFPWASFLPGCNIMTAAPLGMDCRCWVGAVGATESRRGFLLKIGIHNANHKLTPPGKRREDGLSVDGRLVHFANDESKKESFIAEVF